MADTKPDPKAGTEDPDEGDEGAENGDEKTDAPKVGKPLTLTQEELDAMIERRLAKERRQTEPLAAKAKKWDEHEAAQATEQEKADRRAREAEEASTKRIEAANARLVSAELRLEAAAAGVRPEAIGLVVKALAEEVEVDDAGDVKGAKAAVAEFVKANEYLKASSGTPQRSGGQYGGEGGKSLKDRIAEAESKKDWGLAMSLKTQLMDEQNA